MPIPPHAIPALLHRRQQPLPFRHSDGFYRQFCRRFAHDTPPILPAAYASCIPTCTNSPWPVPAYRSDRLRSRLHAHLSANIFRCRFLYVQPASTLFGRLITSRCYPGAGTLQHQPVSTICNPGCIADLCRRTNPSVYTVGSARLFICADRCLAHSRAKPDTLASHCIHYAMSTRFSLPFMGRCKNFCSIIGSFLSFRHNVQLLLPGLNVYPSCISENVSRISHPSVLSATEMPKHLRPVSAS